MERASIVFAAAVVLHNSDHLRRGVDHAAGDVLVVGMTSILVELALIVLVFQRHRLAPLAAAIGGAGLALGYVEVHFLPQHSVLSDSLIGARNVSPLSVGAAVFEIGAAVALSIAGARVLRARGGLSSAVAPQPGQLRFRAALRRPIPLLAIAAHAVGFFVAFVQLAAR